MIKAIIFDFDGVIVDSFDSNYNGYIDLLKKYNFPPMSKEYLKASYGIGPVSVIRKFLTENNISFINADIIKYVDEKTEFAIKHNENISLLENIKPFLDSIYGKVKIGIGTSAPRVFVDEYLKKYDIEKYFEVIISSESVSNHKPAPDVYIKALKELEANANESVVFEDTPFGVDAAKGAGCFCVGITTTVTKDRLEKTDIIIDNYNEITLEKLQELK